MEVVGAEHRQWGWGRALPLKYLLVSEEWDGEPTVWARCAEAEGLFVDPARRRKRVTVVGCAPTGRLLKAVERALGRPGEGVELGALGVVSDFPVPGVDPETDPYGALQDDHWYFDRPVLTDCRPSSLGGALFDLVVEAEIDGPAWRPEPVDIEWGLFNGAGGGRLGECHRVEGLYGDPGSPASPPLVLRGCEPVGPLLRHLVRRRSDGDRVRLLAVDRRGRVMRGFDPMPLGVVASRPSALGGTLVDLWLAEGPAVRPGPGARPVWEAWFEGPPTGLGGWAAYGAEGRAEWAAFAAARWNAVDPRPLTDPVRRLDGRHVTDAPGLLCAIGEAVAGPGGHFPQCWHALRGCPCGGDRVPEPFTLVWQDAEVARSALADHTVDTAGETPYLDAVLDQLARVGVTVELR
ncbi:barstar family protein [Kitasatospora sp. NPDC001664]